MFKNQLIISIHINQLMEYNSHNIIFFIKKTWTENTV